MSIANKLTYLEETKGLIKEKLNDLGAEITDDTFREYVEKLEEIYRNYPKTIFRGADITLPIAKKEKIEIFPIGNTTQDTFTGKNVFNKYGDFNYPDNSSYANATTLLEDGTIKTNANATANISRGIRLSLEVNTTYVVSGKLISSTGINNNLAYIQVRGYTTGWTSLISYRISLTGYFTFTFNSSNCTDWFLSLNTVGDVGTRYEAIFDEIQIEEGSTATSYEPYTGGIASPNSDYPQPIKNVTGNNTVKITLENKEIIEKELNLRGDDYNYNLMKDDYITEDCVIHHKRKKVDLSILNWSVASTNMYYASLSNAKIPSSDNINPLFFAEKYISSSRNGIGSGKICISQTSNLLCYDATGKPTGILEYELIAEETEIIPNTIQLYNQIKELYSMMTTGKTIIIKTESEEENAQLNLEIRTL